jgi:hypothetical protein
MKSHNVRFLVLVCSWGMLAAAAGALHLLSRVPPGMVPIVVGAGAAIFTAILLTSDSASTVMRSLGVRGILGLHLGRFVGFYFLWLHAQGRLPLEFADRAGWGDVATAAGAALLLVVPRGRGFERGLAAWNWFGLADLIVAVGTAAWLGRVRPDSMAEITGLPLALVPLWLVPMYMASHVFLMRRGPSRRACAQGAPPQAEAEPRGART